MLNFVSFGIKSIITYQLQNLPKIIIKRVYRVLIHVGEEWNAKPVNEKVYQWIKNEKGGGADIIRHSNQNYML